MKRPRLKQGGGNVSAVWPSYPRIPPGGPILKKSKEKEKQKGEKNKKKDNKDLLRQSLFNSFQKKHGETNR